MNPFFKENRKLIEKEIVIAVNSLRADASDQYPWSKDALDRLERFAISGKMIRGLLVILSAGFNSKSASKDAIKVGAALELMHAGLLVHDDIMDRDTLRRGRKTMFVQYMELSNITNKSEQRHYGESMASCIGIIAYFLGLGQFGKIKTSQSLHKVLNLFSSEMSLLGLGQMDDVSTALLKSVNEDSCLRVYEQKTGRYTFGLPIIAGLHLAQVKLTPSTIRNIQALVKSLGILFQLRDDYLGVFGDPLKTGKSVGGDIREKKKTWIYFRLLKICSKAEKNKLEPLFNNSAVINKAQQSWVLKLLQSYNMEDVVNSELLSHQTKALQKLKNIPFGERQRAIMIDLINYLTVREK